MHKTISDRTTFAVYLDGTENGLTSAVCRLSHDLGSETAVVDPIVASVAAIGPLAADGITLTPIQVLRVWRELLVQSIIQARASGGWS